MTDEEQRQVKRSFRDAVNMTPDELERWLDTDKSKAVGQKDGGESVGHRSGRRIVRILRKPVAELGDGDLRHMREVVGYVHRHSAQRPGGDVGETPWRYSLKNWGHDPLKK